MTVKHLFNSWLIQNWKAKTYCRPLAAKCSISHFVYNFGTQNSTKCNPTSRDPSSSSDGNTFPIAWHQPLNTPFEGAGHTGQIRTVIDSAITKVGTQQTNSWHQAQKHQKNVHTFIIAGCDPRSCVYTPITCTLLASGAVMWLCPAIIDD